MRFLLHGNFPDGVAAQLAEAGHKVEASGEAADAPGAILEAARRRQYELVVNDRAVLDALLPISGRAEVFGRVLVFLNTDLSDQALAVMRLFDRYKRLTPGRLYTVSPQRVKVAQLPTSSESD